MEEKNDIAQKVMNEIQSGRVKLRSRYLFLAEKLGTGSVFALTILLAVLFCNLVLFYLKASDNLGYLSFGSQGVFAFLESFPYTLVILLVCAICIAGILLRQTNYWYRLPFSYIALALVGAVLMLGVGFTFTGVAERLEDEANSERPTGIFVRPLFRTDTFERERGIAGRVREVVGTVIAIETPLGIRSVDAAQLGVTSTALIAPGDFIMAIGNRVGEVFVATRMRVVNDEEMRLVRHGVRRRFGILRMDCRSVINR